MRRFNKDWFNQYNTWLEYSVEKDAAFCLCYYLFRPNYVGSGGRTVFVGEGYRNWKSKKGFDEHVGDSNSLHNQAYRMCMNLMNQNQSIQTVLDRHSVKEDMNYRIQLNATVDTIRLLLMQGLAFRGHDESESSNNQGNFLEFMRFLGDHNKEIYKVILDKCPQNLKLIAPSIQKEIVNACAEETIKEVIAELGDEWFSVLVDESRDVSVKEQMAVVIRFVNKGGYVVERFLGIVHVPNTTSLQLKTALESLFGKYGLTFSRLRGQGYDGASNMRGEFNGLKTLIMRENGSAYYVHCFAHQLQLTLVAVAKKHNKVWRLFQIVSTILNVVCASCKKRDQLREKQLEKIVEALSNDEIVTGKGLNQEMSLARPCDTRWSSHYKTLNSLIILFSATIDVIEEVELEGVKDEHRGEAIGLLETMRSFDFVFNCHLMRNLLGITNDLSQALQRKNQDVVNAMCLVRTAKFRLQQMRDREWGLLFQEVCAFCEKHGIEIPDMEGIRPGISRRRPTGFNNLHYYRVEMFNTVIDMQLQELNDRFTETTTELLMCMSCLDPNDSFSSFKKDKLLKLAQFYLSDFNQWELGTLENQLENYHLDLKSNSDFLELRGLVELSQKLVEKKKHIVYPLVYKLVKLTLILPVATASVERVFSAMNVVKNDSRNSMGDQWLNDCLVTYIERDLFKGVNNERIMQRFQHMKNRRGNLGSSSST
ncbi:uncharacterized protein LOC144572793 [Carex rostrata]